MAEHAESSTVDYLQPLKKIPSLAFSAFCCALLLKAIAVLIATSNGKGSGFDAAVGLLFHYPESIRAIFAFFAAVLFLWALPLLIYPADVGDLLRRWVVVPSLHIVEHMLSLAVGVLCALLVVELVTGSETLTLVIFGKLVLLCTVLVAFAALSSIMAVFTSQELEGIAQAIPKKFRLPLFVAVGSMVIGAVFLDFVWNYKPIIASGH